MDAKAPEPGKERSRRNPMAVAMFAGLELVASVLLGIFVGKWADGKLGTQPWLTLAGFLLGVSVGFYQLIQRTRVPSSGGD